MTDVVHSVYLGSKNYLFIETYGVQKDGAKPVNYGRSRPDEVYSSKLQDISYAIMDRECAIGYIVDGAVYAQIHELQRAGSVFGPAIKVADVEGYAGIVPVSGDEVACIYVSANGDGHVVLLQKTRVVAKESETIAAWAVGTALESGEAGETIRADLNYWPDEQWYFDQMRHFYRGIIPQRGDQAILVTYNAQGHVSSWQHTGVVDRVSGGRVYLIEGNTSPGTAVIPNGGMVCRKSYPLGDKRIYGYGRPRWDVVAKEMDKMTEKEINDLVDKRVKEAVDKAVKEAVEEAVKPLDAALEKAILELTPKVYRTLEDVPDYWREEVAALMKAGAIQGDGTGKLHITETAAQVMAVLERMRKDEIYNTVAECPAWSREAVQWAVDSGVIQGIGGGKLNLNAMKIWTLQLAYNLANPEA